MGVPIQLTGVSPNHTEPSCVIRVILVGERGGLAVRALFRALGMLLCAALAPSALCAEGGWSDGQGGEGAGRLPRLP